MFADGSYIKPMTESYMQDQQRVEKAASLLGGTAGSAIIINPAESLIDQLKIMAVALQLTTQLPFVLNIEFPAIFGDWLDFLGFINLDLFGGFQGACVFMEWMPTFSMLYLKFIVYMSLPWVLIFILAMRYVSQKQQVVRDIRRELAARDESILNPPNDAVDALRAKLKSAGIRSVTVRVSNRTQHFMKLVPPPDEWQSEWLRDGDAATALENSPGFEALGWEDDEESTTKGAKSRGQMPKRPVTLDGTYGGSTLDERKARKEWERHIAGKAGTTCPVIYPTNETPPADVETRRVTIFVKDEEFGL